jgi:hypothetical protein
MTITIMLIMPLACLLVVLVVTTHAHNFLLYLHIALWCDHKVSMTE